MAAWKPGADAGACGAGILGLAGLPSGGYNRRRWEKTIQILLMFVKNFFLEVAQKKGRTK